MSILPNPCSLCPANCCKSYTITVTAFDVARVCKATGKKPEEFVVFHQARLLSYDPDTTLDMTDDNWPCILGFKSHQCIFLGKDNLCTIHESAPLSCRRYPYTLNSKLNTRFCPLPSQLLFRLKGPDIPANEQSPLVQELQAYKQVVKDWNKKPGKKEDCIRFLLTCTESINLQKTSDKANTR
ncbi:YkgJ family cysteine cluster protein [Candidatus Micrarchaeota archaeon]|nr:YkgJ family cysteine cluster protein [Candidatus Micrarchaeota archaeon]